MFLHCEAFLQASRGMSMSEEKHTARCTTLNAGSGCHEQKCEQMAVQSILHWSATDLAVTIVSSPCRVQALQILGAT